MEMNILVVDDDKKQNKLLGDAIDSYNKTSNIKITADYAITFDEGMRKLKEHTYDGAIVDLRLAKNDIEAKGNEIIQEIKDNFRFPIRVVSGFLGDLRNGTSEDNYVFRKITRGEGELDTIFKDFTDIYSTGITKILNNKGQIQTNISNIFWKHIAEILPEFVLRQGKNPSWEGEKVLLRYISLHILEYLEINDDHNLEAVTDIEFYIKPPIKNKIFTGDIIKNKADGKFGIVLTPACDLATDIERISPKAKFITIAYIYNYEDITDKKDKGAIKNLEGNKSNLQYHFLPKTSSFKGGFIDFQHIQSIPINEIIDKDKFEVECVVTSPFRKDIISRFTNYFSRQGQPSFNS